VGFYTTPNMSLTEPNILQEQAPQWAADLNNSLTLIDQHDHSAGKGVLITPLGLNINQALNFNSNPATNLLNAGFSAYATLPTVSSIVDRIFVSTVTGRDELFYQDSTGANVQITSTGAVNQSSGTIATNGFTGSGYSTAGGSAVAVWTSSSSLYSFTTNGSSLAAIQATSGYFYDSLVVASAGNGITPDSGVQITASSTNAFTLTPITSGGGLNPVAVTYLNSTFTTKVNPLTVSMAAGAASLDVYSVSSSGTSYTPTERLIGYYPSTNPGQGAGLEFWSQGNGGIQQLQGAVAGTWNTVGGHAGLNFWAADSGTFASTVGMQLIDFSGTQALGLLGPAVSGQGVTIYGAFTPNTTGGQNLGSSSLAFGTVWTNSVQSPGGLAIQAATGNVISTESDSGLNVRNTANTAWAQLSCGSLTTNGTTNLTGGGTTIGTTGTNENLTVNGNIFVTGSITQTTGASFVLRASGNFIIPSSPGTITITPYVNTVPVPGSYSQPSVAGGTATEVTFVLGTALPTGQYVAYAQVANNIVSGISGYGFYYQLRCFVASDQKTVTVLGTGGSVVPLSQNEVVQYLIFSN
jgi:hypothetical protein